MVEVKKHLAMLGLRVTDKVTGISGVVTSVGFDLYGCVQAIIDRGYDKDGKRLDSVWFDIFRLTPVDTTPVMPLPNYDFGVQAEGRQGGAEKPLM